MRHSIFAYAAALAVAAMAQIGAGAVRVMDYASALIDRASIALDRAVAFVFETLARPGFTAPQLDRFAIAGGPALDYDAPPAHYLRHEAGTSRRAADRHV